MTDIRTLLKVRGIYQPTFMILAFSLLVGCASDGGATIEANPQARQFKNITISEIDSFQHPVFDGLSHICMPFLDTGSADASLTIDNLAKAAGFREGYNHSYSTPWGGLPSFIYSTGNKDNGSEIDADSNRDRTYCISSAGNMTNKYPSIVEFREWLHKQNPDWELINDEAASNVIEEENLKSTSAFFCKNEHTEYEQVLSYFGQKIREAHSVSINVEGSGKQNCSKYLARYKIGDLP